MRHAWLVATAICILAAPAGATRIDPRDRATIETAAQDALEHAQTGEATGWTNPETGSRGTFTPVAEHLSSEGFLCREYVVASPPAANEATISGMACRLPDGGWQEAMATRAYNPPPRGVRTQVRNSANSWWVVPSVSISRSYCDRFCVGGVTASDDWHYAFALSHQFPRYEIYRHAYREPAYRRMGRIGRWRALRRRHRFRRRH